MNGHKTVPENWKENYLGQDTKNDFKMPSKRKQMFGPTPRKMEGSCYVMPVTEDEWALLGDLHSRKNIISFHFS